MLIVDFAGEIGTNVNPSSEGLVIKPSTSDGYCVFSLIAEGFSHSFLP